MKHVFAVALLAAVLVSGIDAGLDYWKVRIVDHFTPQGQATPNYFFRTDVAATKNHTTGEYYFQHATLMKYFRQRAEEANLTWTDNITLVDINTLNIFKASERGDLKAESDWFAAHPDRGTFLNWIILGSLLDPDTMNATAVREAMPKYEAGKLDIDHLVTRIPAVHSAIHSRTTDGRPVVWFVHCEGGSDRTGEFSGSYKMAYYQWTLKRAQEWNTIVARRPIEFLNRNAMMWYCWYLTYQKGFTGLNCSDYGL